MVGFKRATFRVERVMTQNLLWGLKGGLRVGSVLAAVVLVGDMFLETGGLFGVLSPLESVLAYMFFSAIGGTVVGAFRTKLRLRWMLSIVGFIAVFPFAVLFVYVTQAPSSPWRILVLAAVVAALLGGIGGPLTRVLYGAARIQARLLQRHRPR